MERRTVLRSVLTAVGLAPVMRLGLKAQTAVGLSDKDLATLKALAEVVLPSALGQKGRDEAVDRFARWIRQYREGADRGHSYGASTLDQPTGPSPAARYPTQFDALDDAARAQGASGFVALAAEQRRTVAEAALNAGPRVTTLPSRPTGANLVADFMAYYFNSAGAFDLAYQAVIARDRCRSLDGSDEPPRPLRGL